MGFRRASFLGAVVVALAGVLGATAPDPEQPRTTPASAISFGRDVRPILANNCFKCHGPDPEVRQASLRLDTRDGATAVRKTGDRAVVPGDPAHSRLIELVTSADPDERMPPIEVSRHGLKAEEIETLRRWIEAGAPYETHWSFTPPVRRPSPRVSNPKWCRTDLDKWVLARLDREHVRPSPEASRETLLRRVSLDLMGLPPSPQEIDAFVNDASADAYDKVVDRLLASPRFGEKWARWWLDLARYADTKGYEKDSRRTMWPYRDWVIRSFDADMPLDQFTIEQLAGDMLPDATKEQLVATAFHRNTMTNDEGGTDDEEFRVAAVIDRVNTTMEVWQGLTMACAQCHTHKYDPITQTDYYRFFAFFNNTEDADRDDEEPILHLLDAQKEQELTAAEDRLKDVDRRIDDFVALVPPTEYGAPPDTPQASGEPRDYPWLDDILPARARPRVQSLAPAWSWVSRDQLPPASGVRSFGAKSTASPAQQFFENADPPLDVADGDILYAYAYVDPADPPAQIMLQWYAGNAGWEHRAFWGEDKINYGGTLGSESRRRLGDLPTPGKWVRLEIPATDVGLAGQQITGWAFSQFGGTVYWDNAGLRTSRAVDNPVTRSLTAWVERERGRDLSGLPDDVSAALQADEVDRTQAQDAEVLKYYLRNIHSKTRESLIPLETEAEPLRASVAKLKSQALPLPVMHELEGDARRTTHRFVRGSFLNPAEEVRPGIPQLFADTSESSPASRLELARWLVSPEDPLTARVLANRIWEQLWGTGIVETVEDFGTQGAWPVDQDLLDHLAIHLVDDGWSLKSFLRYIVTSAAYRQSSSVSDDMLARDPYNRLFARAPRFRLDAETIRDAALAASGLLSSKMFGPPVFPPQPEGLWIMIYSSDRWMTSKGEDRYRRGVYTFWRRTVPHPAMTTFDAPSREFCVSRRVRTSTPLQALVTLNDPAYVECAQAMARRVMRDGGGDDRNRIAHAMKLAVGRAPSADESLRIMALLESERDHCGADPDAALKSATHPLGPLPDGMDIGEAAAWTAVCNVILNLDEALTKE